MRAVDSTTDWISAVATVFAAIGTVGAVIVALRQTAHATRRKLAVQCSAVVVTGHPKNPLLALRATNVGSRPVKITMGYFMAANGLQLIQLPLDISCTLPAVLQAGESVELFFARADPEQVARDGDTELVYGFLTDTAGGVYKAWYPGYERPAPRTLVGHIRRRWRDRIDIPR